MIVATPKALAAWYKSVRTEKGLTQTEVAQRCLMTQKQISEFETGKLNVTITTLFRLLNALQLNIDLVEFKPKNNGRELWDRNPLF